VTDVRFIVDVVDWRRNVKAVFHNLLSPRVQTVLAAARLWIERFTIGVSRSGPIPKNPDISFSSDYSSRSKNLPVGEVRIPVKRIRKSGKKITPT
jgi:hypothetical protein